MYGGFRINQQNIKLYEKLLKTYAKKYLPKDVDGWLKILKQIDNELKNFLTEEQIKCLKKALHQWSELDERN